MDVHRDFQVDLDIQGRPQIVSGSGAVEATAEFGGATDG